MARPSSSESARRLISLLGQLTPGARIPLDELAGSLDVTPAQLANDLETLSMCGVAPYTPDQLVEVFVDDGFVEVYAPLPAVKAPVRLSPGEARAPAAALAAAGFTADDPLVSRLLAASSAGFDAERLEHTLRSAIATHDSSVFQTLASATSSHEAVAISYQSEGAAEPTERIVEPAALFAERGAWYLSAWCRSAGAMRTFRIGRIRVATATRETFVVRRGTGVGATSDGALKAFAPEGLPVATLRFEADEQFLAREWPGGRIAAEKPDGEIVADVPFAGTGWIARRVVARLGRVEAVGPAEVRTAVRELALGESASAVE